MELLSLLINISVLAFFTSLCLVSAVEEKKMVCYFTNWSKWRQNGGRFKVDDIDPSICTHLVFAFSKVIGTTMQPYEAGDDNKLDGAWKKFNDLKLQNPNLKTLLAVGGWTHGSKNFTSMVATKASRELFIQYSILILREFNFDGIDIDWEYPGSLHASDKTQFVLFLRELREQVEAEAKRTGRPPLLLTAATAAGIATAAKGYDVPVLMETLDYISIMTFDYHGAWEKKTGHLCPLRGQDDSDTLGMEASLNWYLAAGGVREKMVVSLPMYARTWTLTDPNTIYVGAPAKDKGMAGFATNNAGFLAHYEVCDYANKGLYAYYDKKAEAMYGVYGTQWISFDSLETLGNKLDYILNQGFAGAMVWSLDLDDFHGWYCHQGRNPMLNLINKRVKEASPTKKTPTLPTPKSTAAPTTRPVPATPARPSTQKPIPTTTQKSTDPKDPQTFECPDEYGVFSAPGKCDMYYVCYAKMSFKVPCHGSANYNPLTHKCQEGYKCP